LKYNAGGNLLWASYYNHRTNSNDGAQAITTDGNGNVYVTGYSKVRQNPNEYLTLKYSPSGQLLWARSCEVGGVSDAVPVAIATDAQGQVFVSGRPLTIKYAADGSQVWASRSEGCQIRFEPSGGLILLGRYTGNAPGISRLDPQGTRILTGPSAYVVAQGPSNIFYVAFPAAGEKYEDCYYDDDLHKYICTTNVTTDFGLTKYLEVGSPDRPSINSPPQSQQLFPGENALFSVTATSLASMTFQWFFNGKTLAGATNQSLTIPSVSATNVGGYSVAISNASGTVVSPEVRLDLMLVPLLLTEPADQFVVQGSTLAFSVTASGSAPLSFQWRHNQMPLPRLSTNLLVLENAAPSDAGYYEVVVSNPFGAITSRTARASVASHALKSSSVAASDFWESRPKIAHDSQGNTFLGATARSANAGDADFYVAKLDVQGQPLWSRRLNGPLGTNDILADLAVDRHGNVYITGTTVDRWIKPDLYNPTWIYFFTDILTIKLDAAGNELWRRTFNGRSNSTDVALGMAIDSQGNVLIAGYAYRTDQPYANYYKDTDSVLLKYSPDGTLLWLDQAYQGNMAADWNGPGLALDRQDNIYVIGSGGEFAIMKYNASGIQLWRRTYQPSPFGPHGAAALALGVDGAVFLSGNNNFYSYATAKYSLDGNPVWAVGPAHFGTLRMDLSVGLAVDGEGSLYVLGKGGDNQVAKAAIIKYDAAGKAALLCVRDDLERVVGIMIDRNGNLLCSGISRLVADRPQVFVMASYSTKGELLWEDHHFIPGRAARSLSNFDVDTSGTIHLAGLMALNNNLDLHHLTYRLQTLAPVRLSAGKGTPGTIWLELSGEAGRFYEIQTSPDLRSWSSAGSVFNSTGLIGITNELISREKAFYRAVRTR
jgi:hypothetical protein